LQRFQIQRQALFVAIEMREIETVMRIGSKIAIRIALWRRFDLDDSRAQVSQQGRSVWTGNKRGALDNGKVLQGVDGHEELSLAFGEALGQRR
jgi:hypothetical protein